MRLRRFLSLISFLVCLTPAFAIGVSSTILAAFPPTDTTAAAAKSVSEPPKNKKVGFFKKIGNAVVGFIVKMQLVRENKKASPILFALASLVLLIAGVALLFAPSSGHVIGTAAGLGFVLILLALVFAIVYRAKKRSQKTATKE